MGKTGTGKPILEHLNHKQIQGRIKLLKRRIYELEELDMEGRY